MSLHLNLLIINTMNWLVKYIINILICSSNKKYCFL